MWLTGKATYKEYIVRNMHRYPISALELSCNAIFKLAFGLVTFYILGMAERLYALGEGPKVPKMGL